MYYSLHFKFQILNVKPELKDDCKFKIEKKTRITPNQVFVSKVALKAQSHKNRFY